MIKSSSRDSRVKHLGYQQLRSKDEARRPNSFETAKKFLSRFFCSHPFPKTEPSKRTGTPSAQPSAPSQLPAACPPASPPGPRSPLEVCLQLLLQALDSSRQNQTQALMLWTLAKTACDNQNVPFVQAVNERLPSGGTALRGLIDTLDHTSLKFVHSNLPAGNHSEGVYLGIFQHDTAGYSQAIPFKIADECSAAYRGHFGPWHQFFGYGVMDWVDGKSYAGHWRTAVNIQLGGPIGQWGWMQDGEEELLFKYNALPPFATSTEIPLRQLRDAL